MSIKAHKKIGFIAALTMILGTVVGVGIFLKNHSILKANNWSGTGTLVSWLIGGLLALAAAISFSEISGQKSGKTSGLSDWSEKANGKRFSYLVRTNYSMFYLVILVLVIGMFASETIFSIFTSILGVEMPHFGYIVILGVGLIIFTSSIAFISIKWSGNIQTVTTALKFIPLILVALLGIVMATTNKHSVPINSSGALFGHNSFSNGRSFDFTKMLAALPAVLFAYDAFLVSGQIKQKMKNPNKLPLAVSLGMIIVIILYCFIAIAALLHGSGMVSGGLFGAPPEAGYGIFDQLFSANIAKGLGTFVIIFLAISTYGVLNGLTTGTVYAIMSAVETETFYGTKKLNAKYGVRKSTMFYYLVAHLFYFLLITVPAIIFNNDAILDATSNVPVLIAFLMYAIIIIGYLSKRKKLTNQKMNNKVFYIFSWIAVIGIIFVFIYQFFYGLSIDLIIHGPNKMNSAGLFVQNNVNKVFTNIDLFWTFLGFLAMFITIPIVNYFLIKKIEKRNPIFSTQ